MSKAVMLVALLTGCSVGAVTPLSDLAESVDAGRSSGDGGAVDFAAPRAERISYSVTAPYALRGESAVGPDGDVYSAVPQLGGDPYALVFSYRGLAFSLQVGLASACCNEDVPVSYAEMSMSGSQNCGTWRGTFKMYAPSPSSRWHVAIDAQCATNLSLYLRGDWSSVVR